MCYANWNLKQTRNLLRIAIFNISYKHTILFNAWIVFMCVSFCYIQCHLFCIIFVFSFNAWIVFMCVSFFADPAIAVASQANKEEADARSVFVGNVRNTIFFLFELSLFQVFHSFRLVCWLCWVIWCVILVFLLHNFKYSFLKCLVF